MPRTRSDSETGVAGSGMVNDDPFGMLATFGELNDLADTNTNEETPTRLDLGKAENVMVRSSPGALESFSQILFTMQRSC